MTDDAVAGDHRRGAEGRAGTASRRSRTTAGSSANLLHTSAVVILGLLLILVLPGLLAARFFELDGFLAAVRAHPRHLDRAGDPVAGLVVAAVWRGPFNGAHAWLAVGLGTGSARELRSPSGSRILGFLEQDRRLLQRDVQLVLQLRLLRAHGHAVPRAGRPGRSCRARSASRSRSAGRRASTSRTCPSADYLLKVVLYLYVPYTLLSPFIGVFIDRFPRRRVRVVDQHHHRRWSLRPSRSR